MEVEEEVIAPASSSWTAEDIVNLFEILKEMKEVIFFALGGIFGLIALVLVAIFFLTFKK